MSWTQLSFGRHKGKTLPQVVFQDPDWFFWAYEENVFKGVIKREAEDIYRKATSIKIPEEKGKKLVEYMIHPSYNRFADIQLVDIDRLAHEGSTRTERKKVIDLSYPRRCVNYDKLGCRILIKSFKEIIYGTRSFKITKPIAENFFDNASNFQFES